MKLIVKTDDELEQDGAHEELALLYNLAIAKIVEATAPKSLSKEELTALRDNLVWEIAMFADQGEIVVNGQSFKPRIAFADENDALLPGAAEFDYLHEYATIFDDDLEESDTFKVEH